MTFGTLSSSPSNGGPPIGRPLPPDASPGAGCSKALPGSHLARRNRPVVIRPNPLQRARFARTGHPIRFNGTAPAERGQETPARSIVSGTKHPRRQPGPFGIGLHVGMQRPGIPQRHAGRTSGARGPSRAIREGRSEVAAVQSMERGWSFAREGEGVSHVGGTRGEVVAGYPGSSVVESPSAAMESMQTSPEGIN